MSINAIIQSLTAGVNYGEDAEVLYWRCLTLDGRVEKSDAGRSLSALERIVATQLHTVRKGAQSLIEAPHAPFVLAFRPHGRAFILEREFALLNSSSLKMVSALDVEHAVEALALEARDQEYKSLESFRHIIIEELAGQGLETSVKTVALAASHIAPMKFYVGTICISNCNEIGKDGYSRESSLDYCFQEIIDQGEDARIESLTLLYCLTLLIRSGSYGRPEELNSCQLTISNLAEHFGVLYDRYADIAGCISCDRGEFRRSGLSDQAAILSSMRVQATKHGCFIRHINGINLTKKEEFLAKHVLSNSALSADEIVLIENACIAQNFQISVSASQMPQWVSTCNEEKEQEHFATRLEMIIDAVLRAAMIATGSDVGMTRGVRDFLGFSDSLIGNKVVEACNLSPSSYFCHVVPSVSLQSAMPTKDLVALLIAVSARMRYNSWHYAPSYFSAETIPKDRDWFHAPRMADLAESSDQYHTGHVIAGVRYSIRSPCALRIDHRELPGLVDLRLMRRGGSRYSNEELLWAIKYTQALRIIYQHVVDYVIEERSSFVFSFGDKGWFDRRYKGACCPIKKEG